MRWSFILHPSLGKRDSFDRRALIYENEIDSANLALTALPAKFLFIFLLEAFHA